MGMEFRMTTDLEQSLPAEIGFNFDELKTDLTERLNHYNTLVVTEDAIQDAKSDRANLRKLRETIETRRKEVKRQCEQPYKAFEARVKELTALIDAPIAAIDGQVKAFEQQEKEQKLADIRSAYDELVPDSFKEIIPCERIMDKSWLNKTTTMKSIRERLSEIAKRANVDMALIDGVNPKYKAAVKAKFIETLDVSTALDYQDELMEAEERFKQQEEARAQREAQRAERTVQVPQTEEKPPVTYQEPAGQCPAPSQSGEERLHPLRLEFQITQRQANALKQFLVDNNIKFRKIN